jgi:hypothetical protein
LIPILVPARSHGPQVHSAKPLDKFAALQICQIRTLNKLAATPASHRNGRPLPSFWMILCRFLACASDEQTTPSDRHRHLRKKISVQQPRNSQFRSLFTARHSRATPLFLGCCEIILQHRTQGVTGRGSFLKLFEGRLAMGASRRVRRVCHVRFASEVCS